VHRMRTTGDFLNLISLRLANVFNLVCMLPRYAPVTFSLAR
jgi:hypothetical protein